MNALIDKLTTAADGRYLAAAERDELLAFARALPERFAAADATQEHEEAVVAATLAEMRRRYPRFEQYHDAAWAKCGRDVQLVVRACAQAMTFDDPARLDDTVLFWLRSILAASNLTPAFVRDTYTLVHDGYERALPAAAFALLGPHLKRAVAVLGDFPEPTTPAV